MRFDDLTDEQKGKIKKYLIDLEESALSWPTDPWPAQYEGDFTASKREIFVVVAPNYQVLLENDSGGPILENKQPLVLLGEVSKKYEGKSSYFLTYALETSFTKKLVDSFLIIQWSEVYLHYPDLNGFISSQNIFRKKDLFQYKIIVKPGKWQTVIHRLPSVDSIIAKEPEKLEMYVSVPWSMRQIKNRLRWLYKDIKEVM